MNFLGVGTVNTDSYKAQVGSDGDVHLATYDTLGLHFYLNDALGSRRVQTDAAGFPEQICQSLPFGDQLYCTGSLTSPTEHHFTGKERDTESGLDNFEARYYNSSMGRFMSPDWSSAPDPVPYADFSNPQSMNLYSYALNNPLRNSDSGGHEACEADVWDANTNTIIAGKCHYDWGDLIDLTDEITKKTLDFTSQVTQQLVNIAQTPNGVGCMAGLAASGGMVGATYGVGIGLAGLAFGGVGVFLTEPAGLAIGGVGGALSGAALAMTACPGGAANGGGGSGGGGGGLSRKAKSKLGNLADYAGEKVRDVIRSRGGSGSNVNQVGQWADRTLGEAAEAAVRGDSSAETAIKIVKQASRLGQQY